jgi:hypothetical protein
MSSVRWGGVAVSRPSAWRTSRQPPHGPPDDGPDTATPGWPDRSGRHGASAADDAPHTRPAAAHSRETAAVAHGQGGALGGPRGGLLDGAGRAHGDPRRGGLANQATATHPALTSSRPTAGRQAVHRTGRAVGRCRVDRTWQPRHLKATLVSLAAAIRRAWSRIPQPCPPARSRTAHTGALKGCQVRRSG